MFMETDSRIRVRIPARLRKFTGRRSTLFTHGSTLRQVVENLNQIYPGIIEKIYDESKSLRPSVNVYINREDIRYLQGRENRLEPDDEIYLVPAASGG